MVDEVIVGNDDQLFLAKSVHNILDHITGKIKIPESSLVNFYKNITNREAFCRERGIKYKHVIYPDKSTVMRSYFPISDITPFSVHYQPYYTNSVLDLQRCLHDSDKHYFKTDTHLNFEGKKVTSIEIMKSFFDFDISDIESVYESFRGGKKLITGDLGSKMQPKIQEHRHEIVTRFLKRFHNQVGANDGFAVVCMNKDKLQESSSKRLLIFGDSFCERSLQFFAYFYSEVLFCRSRYFHDEIVNMFQPDHIITESAERYFSNVRIDELAPRFNLVYGLKGAGYSDNKEFYMALNAVLNFGRIQHSLFIHKFLYGKLI